MIGGAHVSSRLLRALANTDDASRRPGAKAWKLVSVAAGAALIGLFAGLSVRPASNVSASVAARAQGACVAMDMAAAYGFLDDAKRKVVTRALSQQSNNHALPFPAGYRALSTVCAEVAATRWSAP